MSETLEPRFEFTKEKFEECLHILDSLACNVDQDCPAEYRTRHLHQALEESYAFLEEVYGE